MANNKPRIKKIKDYVILSKVGKGGMGEVYLAKHPTLKRGIILKRLSIKDKESSERFLKEAKMMLEFRHENIVQIYDHFKEGNSTYIAMEYVKGKPLNEVIQDNGKIPIPLALFILYQVSLGLYHAHSKKVIHRDIKPHNILISTDGEIKLTDFGIAKTSDESDSVTSPGTIIGTPAYMSPEQFSDSSEITFQSDIYSLGVVFYEMITGVKPYKNEFTPEVLTAISKGRCTPATKLIKDLPPIVKKILKKTFNPKLRRRYKSLYHLIKILRKYFKKFNVYEVRASIKRLLVKDKKILESPFFVSYKRQRIRSVIFSSIFFGILIIGLLAALFVYTNTYYELIVPDKYGKVLLEFERVNLDPENIFIGIDGKYEKANFKKFPPKLIKKRDKNRKVKYVFEIEILKKYSKDYYLTKGEHEFNVVSGSYKNSKKIIILPRIMQRKSKRASKGQNVNIQIGELQPKDVIVFFRFWDSISNKPLFNFDYYPEKYVNRVKDEEDNLKIFYNKRYITLKDYIQLKYKSKRDPFSSDSIYYFLVENFKLNESSYESKRFNVKFALDDRTVYIHTPLTPKPSKIKITSTIKNLPLIINNEKEGLAYSKDEYIYQDYKSINFSKLKNNKYYSELLIPPGNISFKISSNGKLVKKVLKSGEELVIDVKKEHGKFVY